MNKQQVYEEARALMVKLYGPQVLDQLGNCVFWLQCAGSILLERYDLTPLPQAGTMLWRRLPADLDDGTQPTHFGFKWEPDHPLSRAAMARNKLPELHTWIFLRETREIIDFSTGNFKRYAEQHGMPWLTADPPLYLWANVDEMPADAIYQADPVARQWLIARKMKDASQAA